MSDVKVELEETREVLAELEGSMAVSYLVEMLQGGQHRYHAMREERDDLRRELEAERDRFNRLQEDNRRLDSRTWALESGDLKDRLDAIARELEGK